MVKQSIKTYWRFFQRILIIRRLSVMNQGLIISVRSSQENHPAGQALPIVYTEIGRWMNAYLIDKEETMDSPSLFTEWAGIYANNMKNGGYGMWAFKFANTASGPYPRGIKSGHHLYLAG